MESQVNARKGKEKHGKTRQGKEKKGNTSQDKTREGNSIQGKARHSSPTKKMNHKIQEYHNNHEMKQKFQSIINLKYLFKYSFYTLIIFQWHHLYNLASAYYICLTINTL
jgi:hypothetical protein